MGSTATISPETRLRKLSLQLRGYPPSQNEYAELAKINPNDINTYFAKITNTYLNSSWGTVKLTEKIFEDLRIDLNSDYLRSNIWSNDFNSINNASTNPFQKSLFSTLNLRISMNERWDSLLINKDMDKLYKVYFLMESTSSIYQNYNNSMLRQSQNNFAQVARTKGFDFNSIESMNKAIADFEANPTAYPNVSPYFKNSKAEPEFNLLLLQGAFNYNSTKQNELLNYFLNLQMEPEQWFVKVFGPETPVPNNNYKNAQAPNYLFNFQDVSSRYKKTIYSKAAAFFRIYLCDDMKQVVLSEDKNKGLEIINKILKAPTPSSNASTSSSTQAPEAHVKNDCIACHRKLDPVEKVVNQKSTTGEIEFVYDDYRGKEVRVKVDSIKNLPNVLAEQPQFIKCQTEKFWNWYIGEDVPLTPNRHEKLMSVYKESNANPKKMIAYLTSLPEYTNDESSLEPTQFNNVRSIIQRCHACHTSEPGMPSFVDLPINENKTTDEEKLADHLKNIKSIVKVTDLLKTGSKVTMPPKKSGWALSDNERYLLTRWIYFGSRDENGKELLTSENIKEIFSVLSEDKVKIISSKPSPKVTFRNTWTRLIQNYDLLKILPTKIRIKYSECYNTFTANKLAIGQREIFSGLPLSDEPTVAFREVYNKCIMNGINSTKDLLLSTTTTPEAQYYMNAFGLLELSKNNINFTSKWTSLPEEEKAKVLAKIIDFQVGPNISSSSHLPQYSSSMLLKRLTMAITKASANNAELSILEAASYAVYFTLNQDQFFTF